VEIPGLGVVAKDDELDWYRSGPIPVPVLGGQTCRFVVEDYDDDPNKDDFHAAIANFLSLLPAALKETEPHIFRYYKRFADEVEPDESDLAPIASPAEIWDHIRFDEEPLVTRRSYGDEGVYISLECECSWEPEHGLQIVFQHGLRVNKIGQYDGHLSNADAYDDEELEDVIYHG